MKYRFANCELDLDTRELSINGDIFQTEPQVFDLLVFFAENPGRVISHTELIKMVWSGRIVSDSAVAARISSARKAVGDNGKKQNIIRTVSRKGFKFLPTVEIVQTTTKTDEPSPKTETTSRQSIHFCKSKDGTNIAYATTGNGIPLIRTGHWLTHLEHDWQSPIWRPFLTQLGEHFEVTRYDQRGCGLTDRNISDFSFDRFVEDLEAVTQSIKHERFVLYATSQGVPVAIKYATLYPERVSHLICHGGYVVGRLVRENQAEVEQGLALLKLMEIGWGVIGSPFLRSFTTMYIPDASREERDSLVDLQRTTASPENAVKIRQAVDQFNAEHLLPEVTSKTLVIHAIDDGVHPLEQARLIAANVAGSQLVVLESSNHALISGETEWQRFFDEIKTFVAE